MNGFEQIAAHRQQIANQIQKSIGEDSIEKAYNVGDIFIGSDGKPYIYTEYAPGKYDWHVIKKGSVMRGKGIGGKHGVQAIEKAYKDAGQPNVDIQKVNLKRTPNGNWRLFYDDKDTGSTIDGNTLTEQELMNDGICYQNRMVVDNFDLVGDYMEFNSPDDVYFVQIIKRWKDNKDKPGADDWKAAGQAKGSYHSGAEYMKYWLIHNKAELDAIKPEIIKACSFNNARAYVSINSRSQSQVNAYLPYFKSKFSPNDPRHKNAEAILYGQAKSGDKWKNERFKVLLDIDTPRDTVVTMPDGSKVNAWDEAERRLKAYGVKVAAKYETPSGGLHLILNNKNNRNLSSFYKGLKDFDGGRDLGKMAMVHPSEDIKMVLYSNVSTGGY